MAENMRNRKRIKKPRGWINPQTINRINDVLSFVLTQITSAERPSEARRVKEKNAVYEAGRLLSIEARPQIQKIPAHVFIFWKIAKLRRKISRIEEILEWSRNYLPRRLKETLNTTWRRSCEGTTLLMRSRGNTSAQQSWASWCLDTTGCLRSERTRPEIGSRNLIHYRGISMSKTKKSSENTRVVLFRVRIQKRERVEVVLLCSCCKELRHNIRYDGFRETVKQRG